jgi:GntR family transcriptional regulator
MSTDPGEITRVRARMSREHEEGGSPKYRQIADALRAAIEADEYEPGDRLPGENELMTRHGVARMTVRQALAQLQAEGLTVARKGSGVFVREFRPIRRRGVERLAAGTAGEGRSIWDADIGGRELVVDQIEVSETEPPEPIARVLGPGRTLVRSRRYVLDGEPVLLAVSYLPAALVSESPIAELDPGPGGIYARLADLGYEPARFKEELRARMPTGDESRRLALAPATPVVLIYRTAYTAEGTPVEVNEMTLDASAYVIEYAFERPT